MIQQLSKMLLYCKNKSKTFNCCRCYFRDEAFSEHALLHSLVFDMILRMDKKKKKKKNETWWPIIRIDRSVVGNQYVARRLQSVTCEARADSASGDGFKLDSNTDI